ncbi:lithostathine-2-like [Micropterus dolomieu]|uniref:lithostathine-2-like n=1 Tax=Micropterus dolomieu TaxID=147949 RepID=UPI001E8E3B6F|nr:lithostathine-2-like [Micropterus dolomieu]
MAKLNDLIGRYDNIWIGLHSDTEAWKWSLENQDYYGDEGEAGFRMWNNDEPNGDGYYKVCAAMLRTEYTTQSFICVNETMSWMEAQSYCREHYSDLASVRNQTENDQMNMMATTSEYTWIGLYRDSWKWSDGSAHTFSNWAPSAPSTSHKDSCAVSNSGKWSNQDCNSRRKFICYRVPTMRKQVLKVVLKNTHSSVDMEELKEDILQKLSERLDRGLTEGVKLRWAEQSDGKSFHKKNTDKKNCTPK